MNVLEAIQQINYAVNRAHNRHIAPGSVYNLVYQEKAEQAADYVAAKYPKSLSGYPLIEAEVKATKKSAKDVADAIINRRAEWLTTSSKIEELRLGAKQKIYEDGVDIYEIVQEVVKKLDEV